MANIPKQYDERPHDAAWAKRVDELTERCAKELGALVVLIAAQEQGKMGICVGGLEIPGAELDQYREILKSDMPRFFHTVGDICRMGETGEPPSYMGPDGGPSPQLKAHMQPFIDVIARLLRVHEGRSDEEADTLALQMLAAAARDAMRGSGSGSGSGELPDDAAPLEVRFAPGCFDDFEGSPEQLQELIAEAKQMFATGEYVKRSRRLTAEEMQALAEKIEAKRKANTRQ